MDEEIRCINNKGKMAKERMGKWWLTLFELYIVYSNFLKNTMYTHTIPLIKL